MDLLRAAFACVVLLIPWFAAGCDSGAESCTPGRQVSCTCSDGALGAQVCEGGRYGSCWCGLSNEDGADGSDPWLPDGNPDDGSDGSPEDGEWDDVDAGNPGDGFVLARGDQPLVDLFAHAEDVLVVDQDGVTRFSKAGIELARWTAPRALQAAAFDGENLIVTDGAKLNALAPGDLGLRAEALLIEGCASTVLLPNSRFVCSSSESAYYVYDAASLVLLSRSDAQFSRDGRMHAVPGTSAFLVGDSSRSLYYELDVADQVVMKLDHWDVSIGSMLAFDANPAQNVVTDDGALYALAGCALEPVEGCFERTGNLGTLTGEQAFVGMDSEAGVLVGLIDPAGSHSFDERRCDATACILQRVDVAERTVLAQEIVRVPLRAVVRLRTSGADVLLGARTGDAYGETVGYEVTLLTLP